MENNSFFIRNEYGPFASIDGVQNIAYKTKREASTQCAYIKANRGVIFHVVQIKEPTFQVHNAELKSVVLAWDEKRRAKRAQQRAKREERKIRAAINEKLSCADFERRFSS